MVDGQRAWKQVSEGTEHLRKASTRLAVERVRVRKKTHWRVLVPVRHATRARARFAFLPDPKSLPCTQNTTPFIISGPFQNAAVRF